MLLGIVLGPAGFTPIAALGESSNRESPVAEGRDLGCSPRCSQGKSKEISQRRREGPHNPEEKGQLVGEAQGGKKDTRKVFRSF